LQVLLDNWRVFPRGLAVTLEVGSEAILIGTVLGVFIGLGLIYAIAPLRWAFRIYVDILRGLPLLVTIFVFFYGAPFLGLPLPRKVSVTVALGIFAAAHMAEIVRGSVSSIPKTQQDAAMSIGLTFWQRMRYVILPQAARRSLPPWVNLSVEMFKGTSLVSLVGVADLLLSGRHVLERTQEPLPIYFALAVIYFFLAFGLSRIGALLERRFDYAI
jgi:polar amino acid transport system permease protein